MWEDCLKKLALVATLLTSSCFAYELEQEESVRGVGNGRMVNSARDALMSYDVIAERSEYLLYRFKKLTLGDYADKLLILAPIVSGNIEVQAYKDVNVFYNRFSQSGGFRYNINF